jgi:hypothetical protein
MDRNNALSLFIQARITEAIPATMQQLFPQMF